MPRELDSPPLVMLVTRNFPPLLGGMENLNARLVMEISRSYRVALCGPAGSGLHAGDAIEVVETKIYPLSSFLALIFIRASTMSLRLRPKVILAGSGLTLPAAWFAAKLSGARLGVYLHGLDIIAPSRIYQLIWPRFIKSCDFVMVNSRSTAALAAARDVDLSKIHIVHPGTSIPVLRESARANFRSTFELDSQPILLSVGRLTRRKGLAEFVSNALPQIVVDHPGALLLIVGEEAKDALTSVGESERRRIEIAAKSAGVEAAVRFIGRLDDSQLTEAYQAADLHVFPVLEMKGDVEGFGMVALESAAHGLRTVAFDVGGVGDAVLDSVTGSLVVAGDYAAFSRAVAVQLSQSHSLLDRCRDFAKSKSWDVFGEKVRGLLNLVTARD